MAIIREYEGKLARVISEPDNGMYDALAKGFALATGEVLAYINADDVFEPGSLLRIGEYFRDNPRVMVSYRDCTVTVDGWRFPNRCQPLIDFPDLLRGHILNQEGIQFRREAYLAVGGVSRDFRLAGDYDLWLRFSRRFRLDRTTGHVGSFRVRPGQLSQDMEAYRAEQTVSQNQIRSSWSSLEFLPHAPRYLVNRCRRFWERIWGRPRFYYPFAFQGRIAPGQAPDPFAPPPKCPLTGRPADSLLFSSLDTRYGDQHINYVYYCGESQLAVVWPPTGAKELAERREQRSDDDAARLVEPPAGYCSPYRHYRPRRKWRRLALRLRLPKPLVRVINRREQADWKEACFADLCAVLGRRYIPSDKSVRFLQVGDGDSEMLDAVCRNTCWQSARLDVMNLDSPPQDTFEIIYLGQTIQRCDDPLSILRKLRPLLKANGVLVITTPNLDSRQVDLFGPTWAHWHTPYHRTIFSPRALRRLGELAGLRQCRALSRSHTKWTALSMQLNSLGVAGAVSERWKPTAKVLRRSSSITAWARLLWNWRDRGDYLVAMFESSEKHKLYLGD